MKIINIYKAKTEFSKLVELVQSGEEVIISKAGKPMAKLVAYQGKLEQRVPGYWKNQVRIADDFDASLPAEILDGFYGD